jgi:site-specific recombinase XerD
MTLSKAIERFKEYTSGIYSDATVKTYLKQLNLLLKVVGDKEVKELTFEDIMKFKNSLYEKGNASSSVAVSISSVYRFFDFLQKVYKLNIIPKEDLKILRPKVSQKIPSYLDRTTIQNLVSTCKDIEEEIIVKLLFYTGIRASELLSLKEKDFIQIDNQWYIKIKGKGGYERRIPLIDEVVDTVQRYITYIKAKGNFTDKLFPFTYNTLYYRIKKIAQRIGLDEITPHWLRHTCATEMLTQGVDIRVIAEICGHKSLNTTMRYAKVKPAIAKEAIEKLKI